MSGGIRRTEFWLGEDPTYNRHQKLLTIVSKTGYEKNRMKFIRV